MVSAGERDLADLIGKYKIWDHSRIMTQLNLQRVRNEAVRQTCLEQLRDLLVPVVKPGMTLLDAGCGPGHYFHSLKELDIEYHGLDFTAHYIEMGREYLPASGLPAEKLSRGLIENIDSRFDIVICFNALLYCPDFHQPLERLCEAANRYLVIRTLLAERGEQRYVRDGYLDKEYNHLKAYFNIYPMVEFVRFIESYGFEVQLVVDRRTNDRPEWVNDMIHPWRIMFCKRMRDDRVPGSGPPAKD